MSLDEKPVKGLSASVWPVPSVNPETTRKAALAKRFREKLTYFQRIPLRRREAECADEGRATCRALLRELGER